MTEEGNKRGGPWDVSEEEREEFGNDTVVSSMPILMLLPLVTKSRAREKKMSSVWDMLKARYL